MNARSKIRLAVSALVLATLGGCMVGPNFREPASPVVTRFTQQPLPEATASASISGGGAQRFTWGKNAPTRWWRAFGNPELSRRVEVALRHSPTVASAHASLRQAAETARAAGGTMMPGVDASGGAVRQKLQAATDPLKVFNTGVEVGYVVDVFGGIRRRIESRQALASVQKARLDATYLTLAANVVTASLREASLRDQVSATELIITSLKRTLVISEEQESIGARSLQDTLAVRSQLATTTATLPPLRKQLAITRNELATYLGVTPAQLTLKPVTLDQITLPVDIPVSLPSMVVAQRPDIQAAAAQLHAATADVGVATANMLPRLTLSGNIGSQATTGGDLLSSGTGVWSLGLSVMQPLFHGGQLLHQKRAAEAGRDKALADWNQAVLVAFQNVADALGALVNDADSLKAETAAEQDATQLLALVQKQYQTGAVGYLNLLSAQQQYQRARIDLIQARSARLADTAALYVALGGSWKGNTTGKYTAGSH